MNITGSVTRLSGAAARVALPRTTTERPLAPTDRRAKSWARQHTNLTRLGHRSVRRGVALGENAKRFSDPSAARHMRCLSGLRIRLVDFIMGAAAASRELRVQMRGPTQSSLSSLMFIVAKNSPKEE